MNPARIELKLVLDQAGIGDISLDTFSQRFNIQKRVYLIQLMGCDLGFRFGWYIRGPYAPPLTADAFTLRDELSLGERDYQSFKLADETAAKIEKAKRLWGYPSAAGVSPDQWLELLASVHYLKHIAYWPKGSAKDFESVFKSLVEAKPQFTSAKAAAERAWDRLDEFGLIAAKTVS